MYCARFLLGTQPASAQARGNSQANPKGCAPDARNNAHLMENDVKLLLTGGSGVLGTELQKLAPDLIAPSQDDLDVTDLAAFKAFIDEVNPDVVIHAAAITNNREIEADPSLALEVNIKGTANVALACLGRKTRLVYLSTDYAYLGDRGGYTETDPIAPFNLYAWTKVAGEAAVRAVPNHLILRLSFGARTFVYPVAFTDKWSSKEYVDLLAPDILEAALSPLTGVLHLGGERRSLFELAKLRRPDVKPIARAEAPHDSPRDTSLDLERWNAYREGRSNVKAHRRCRVCGSAELATYLDLGMMPLANNLATSAILAQTMERFPLQVMFCKSCALSQLSVLVDPELLFAHYTYRSSVNKGYILHCRKMAQELKGRLGLGPDELVVDIAGNDGALLGEFKSELGVAVVNVDPAQNLGELATARGIPTISKFWSMQVAQELVERYGRPKLITATNVFAHVDDVRAFLRAVKHCLREDGVLMLEFPYLLEFIKEREFDTVYFEHLSFIACLPLLELMAKEGLQVFDVQPQAIHGGTIRVFIGNEGRQAPTAAVAALVQEEVEQGFDRFETYQDWAHEIDALVADLKAQVRTLKQSGARIAAFGASAKGNTLLNVCRFNTDSIEYIVDDTPEKLGKFSPGTGIPIVARSVLAASPPDYLVILAWNFAKEIIQSTLAYGDQGGRYIIPIPAFRIVSQSEFPST